MQNAVRSNMHLAGKHQQI